MIPRLVEGIEKQRKNYGNEYQSIFVSLLDTEKNYFTPDICYENQKRRKYLNLNRIYWRFGLNSHNAFSSITFYAPFSKFCLIRFSQKNFHNQSFFKDFIEWKAESFFFFIYRIDYLYEISIQIEKLWEDHSTYDSEKLVYLFKGISTPYAEIWIICKCLTVIITIFSIELFLNCTYLFVYNLFFCTQLCDIKFY